MKINVQTAQVNKWWYPAAVR